MNTELFVPDLPSDYATVMGPIRTLEEWKELYLVDEVEYVDVVEEIMVEDLSSLSKEETEKLERIGVEMAIVSVVMLLKGENSDSGNIYEPPTLVHRKFKFMDESNYIDRTTLFPILAECRVIKSETELYLLRYVTEVTSFGHTYVMRNFHCGMYEYQGESLFRHYCYYNYGTRLTGYTPICGCGPSSAILHYGHAGEPNMKQSTMNNTICLFDMGVEYYNYGSDVTCSFPSNGTFNKQQKIVYEAVLNAQITVYKMMKPGVSWVDCHKAAEATILTALVEAGIVLLSPNSSSASTTENGTNETTTTSVTYTDKTIDELVEMRLGAVFMPHGLGHFIGLDTHDVGGYIPSTNQKQHPKRILLPGLQKLRTARILECNMVLTVEPGCYFIQHLLDTAMDINSPLHPYINITKINEEYTNFGGIRLEDVVQVTQNGIINYTLCPRTIYEVESVMAGTMKWPPTKDLAPELFRLRLTDTKPLPSPPSL